jgi:peroxiredoxin
MPSSAEEFFCAALLLTLLICFIDNVTTVRSRHSMTQTYESNLQQQLDEQKRLLQQQLPPDLSQAISDDIDRLVQSDIVEHSLKAGAKAPDFSLPSATGETVSLSTLLQQGPVVLTFYRGSWCPYCNLQLHAYQQILAQIQSLGATLVAVSTQTPDNSLTIIEKQQLAFSVLTDAGNSVAREYGLVFKFSQNLCTQFKRNGLDLEKFNGNDSWELPMPGTFIIDRDGIIKLAFVDADFRHRLEPAALLESLQSLQQ